MAEAAFIVILIFLVFLVVAAVSQYNRFSKSRHEIAEARSNIAVILQKRLDLVRQLAAASYGYAQIEVPAVVSIARTAVDMQSMQSAASQIAAAMNRILLLTQQYPELQSSAQFQQLMAEQAKIEEDLQVRREAYNAKVKDYNIMRTRFPGAILAGVFGIPEMPYWHAEASDKEMKVSTYQAPGIPGGIPAGYMPGGINAGNLPYASSPQIESMTSAAYEQRPALTDGRGGVHAWLEVIHGATGSPLVTVYDGLIIGRGRGVDVQLTDIRVSRRHAIIRVKDGACYLQDQRSANGTFVNERRVSAIALKDNDRIQIGDAELVFHVK